MKKHLSILQTHIKGIIPKLQRKVEKGFTYPWVAAAYGLPYVNCQVFWDGYHECLRFAYDGEPQWMYYLIDNHFTYQDRETGWVPQGIAVGVGCSRSEGNLAQPFLVQGALLYFRLTQDKEWLKSRYSQIESYLGFLHRERCVDGNLYGWFFESGCDNDVATMFYPPRSVASVHASSLIYMEHLAMSKIAAELGRIEEAEKYRAQADKIKDDINDRLWIEEIGSYANRDLNTGNPIFSLDLGEHFATSPIGKYAFFSWNYMMPLYVKIPTQERAKRIIENYLLNTEHFWSPHGIRTLSKKSEYYNNAIWGNPARYSDPSNMTASNWQGPVWVVSNYFLFHGLINYGYKAEALELADKTVRMLAEWIKNKGCMFENYHAETGEPLYAPWFGSWNILADKMHQELNTGFRLYDHLWI